MLDFLVVVLYLENQNYSNILIEVGYLDTCLQSPLNANPMCWKFIWSGATRFKKLYLANWATLCQLKEYGGFNLKDLQLMNDALLMKLGWSILTFSNKYWVQLVCSKYDFDPTSLVPTLPTTYRSYL